MVNQTPFKSAYSQSLRAERSASNILFLLAKKKETTLDQ